MVNKHLEYRQQIIDLIATNAEVSIADVRAVYNYLIMYDLIDYDLEKEVFSELFEDE